MAGKGRSFTTRHAGVMALLAGCGLASILPGPDAWAQASRGSEAARYTVFVSVTPPVPGNRPKVLEMLKAEGYASHEEGDAEIALVVTAEEIRQLFNARVRLKSVEGSAARGLRQQPYLENVTIPRRFRRLIGKVYIDPQRG